jgi:hypothetical protein
MGMGATSRLALWVYFPGPLFVFIPNTFGQ